MIDALRRRAARNVVLAIVAVGGMALAPVAGAQAATPFSDVGRPGGPLTRVAIGNELSCQVRHTGDTANEFYPSSVTPGDCGTFLVTGDALFAPDFESHGTTATGSLGDYTPFTPVSQSAVTGSGTRTSPRRVVTTVSVGSTGLRITEVNSYVSGQESYRTDTTVTNTGGAAQTVILYRAGDCFLQNTDVGFGFRQPSLGAVGCSVRANNSPPGRIEEWVPITRGNNFYEARYSEVWAAIGTHTAFPDTCRCTDSIDNGAGISWSFTVAPGASVTRSHFTTFSPAGIAGAPETRPPSTSSTRLPSCSATGRVRVTVRDNAGGSGPRSVRYRIDGGPLRTVTTSNTSGTVGFATITLPNGRHRLTYAGVDRAGNVEAAGHSATVRVDRANRCRARRTGPRFTG